MQDPLIEAAADAARANNGTAYDWRDADPKPIAWAKSYAIAVGLAAALFLVIYPFSN